MFLMGSCPVCGGFELVTEECEVCGDISGRVFCLECESEFDEEFLVDELVTVECPICGGIDCDAVEEDEDLVFTFECYECETTFIDTDPHYLSCRRRGVEYRCQKG